MSLTQWCFYTVLFPNSLQGHTIPVFNIDIIMISSWLDHCLDRPSFACSVFRSQYLKSNETWGKFNYKHTVYVSIHTHISEKTLSHFHIFIYSYVLLCYPLSIKTPDTYGDT